LPPEAADSFPWVHFLAAMALPFSRLRTDSVPCRGRSHSAENAAVLTLQKTQRKDWRFQTPLTGITVCPETAEGKGHGGKKMHPQE